MAIVVEITAHRSKAKAAKANSFDNAEEIATYRTLVQSLIDRHCPASPDEQVLVQSLADIEWRLSRIPRLEAGIYATGRRELVDLHSEQDPAIRAGLIEAEIFMKYRREFCDLSLQETRLLGMRRKALARLRH
jgi:hypothetical protein